MKSTLLFALYKQMLRLHEIKITAAKGFAVENFSLCRKFGTIHFSSVASRQKNSCSLAEFSDNGHQLGSSYFLLAYY